MRNQKRFLVIAICLMLIVCAAMTAWLVNDADKKGEARQLAANDMAADLKEPMDVVSEAPADPVSDIAAASHVYSHRGGAAGVAEEHSLDAYDYAVQCGSWNIEPDVVLSADGTLYISHDISAYALTGVSRTYSEMTDDEIDDLRTHQGNKILRLSEVFDRYGKNVCYIIEIKEDSEKAADEFARIVTEYGYEDNIVVQSKYLDILKKLEPVFPDVDKLCICKTQAEVNTALDADYVDIIGARVNLMTDANCRAAHDRGKQFNVWTLDSPDQIRAAIELGVDTYFTNDTKLALSLERQYRKK